MAADEEIPCPSGPSAPRTSHWGAVISAQLLAEHPEFARGWVILDTHVPVDPALEQMSRADRLRTVEQWRTQYMDPLLDPDEWAAFNSPPSYAPSERQLLYHGMFMATPRAVVFQYWRENGLRDVNSAFSSIKIPVLEIKALSPRVDDAQAARRAYLDQYKLVPPPPAMRTVFVEGSGHHIIEHHPDAVDDAIHRFATGRPAVDYPQD